MTRTRWWDAVVPVSVAAICTLAAFGIGRLPSPLFVAILIVGAAFVAAYAVLARPLIERDEPGGWRAVLFVAAAGAALCVGVAAIPLLAVLQTLAYPLAWLTTGTRRGGILASVALSASVFGGYLIGGSGRDAVIGGLLVAVLSLIFSVAFGLWITSVYEYADERERLVSQLTAAQSEIAALNHERGVTAQGERVARDIHDTLAQSLAGLVLLSERARRQSRDGEADAAAQTVGMVEQIARDALAEARALVARTAAVPADEALAASIERLVARFRAEAGLEIALAVDTAPRIDREAQVVVLRCLQEALANVRKHAAAARVEVSVVAEGESVVLSVIDDGRGFDAEAPRTGFGLDGMRDRAALAGGTLTVDAAPGEGTRLAVRLPLVDGGARPVRSAAGRDESA